MRIFLDANLLVSVLNKEYPLFTYSSRILSLADNRKYTVFTSPICLAIAFYFAEKKAGTAIAKKKIEVLAGKISITTVGEKEVIQSLLNKKINDFEDGIQYYAAKQYACHVIITEDVDYFYFSDMEVIKPKEFVEKYLL